MKPTPFKIVLTLAAVVTGGAAALAQSNGVPGPDAYASFSQFIADRNIFDPSRQPHIFTSTVHHVTRTKSLGLPSIELVGTMVYEKGPFAFFNANDEENRKALAVGGEIAGYRVASIAGDSVQLETADKKETHTLNIGEGLQQENGKWVFAKLGDVPIVTGASVSQGRHRSRRYGNSEESSPSAAAEPPPSASEQNEALKRLMQLREQENQ
jgi:hypothetical protein